MARGRGNTQSKTTQGTTYEDSNPFSVLEPNSKSHNDPNRDPYYIYNSDHPSANLVPNILTRSDNYHSWKRTMTVSLLARNKMQFVNRKLSQPDEDDEDYDARNRCNSLISGMIFKKGSEKGMLQGYFQAKSSMQLLNLGDMGVTTYFTRRKALWDLIQEYRPLPPCQCGAKKIIQGYQEEDKVLKFLIGLNESYNNVRCQILMQEPLHIINRAYASVILEERQREICSTNSETSKDTSASTVETSNDQFAGSSNFNRSKVTCSHCGIPGLTMSKCYKIHGYPLGHKYYNRFLARDSGASQNGKVVANFSGSQQSESNQIDQNGENDQDLISTLIVQCQKLMSMLSQKNSDQSPPQSNADQPIVSHESGHYEDSADWDG
uniref:Retrotransposon Copia-like N-terminal domain-containing protein n=1 Tax=Cannabis sativa TaxID=3483 RepID=A0A803QQV4_CANSA